MSLSGPMVLHTVFFLNGIYVGLGCVYVTEFVTDFVLVLDFAKVYFFKLRLLKECSHFPDV